MISTLRGALEARGIPTDDRLIAEIEGDYAYEERDKNYPQLLVKVPRRLLNSVRLHFRITIPLGKRKEVEQALDTLDQRCAVNRSLQKGIDLSYTWDIQEEGQE